MRKVDLGNAQPVDAAEFVEPTEDAIALAFAEKHRDKLRYDHTRGKWCAWDGARWKIEETQLAFAWARDLCRTVNRKHGNATLPKIRTAAAVEKFAQADRRFAVTFEQWNRDPWLLCTPDGTVELRTGELRENRPADLITKITAVGPRVMSTPTFDRFLTEATRGDDDLVRFLQVIFGYSLTGITREHALFFFYGGGGNGKGVLINSIAAAMNEYHVASNMDAFTSSKYDRHPTELARLHGARMVTASETEEGRAWAESRIKQLTGGDRIAARYMRRDFFEYTPEFKLVFMGNHKPVLNSVDDAAKRRFNILPFIHKPDKPDKDLPEKLITEYPGILHWCIEGCLEWQENGLIIPEVVKQETAAYFHDQDLFSQWLEECTEKKYETLGEPSQRLFNNWKKWTEGHGEHPGTYNSFKDRMRRSGYQEVRRAPGTNQRGFMGLSLVVSIDERRPYAD